MKFRRKTEQWNVMLDLAPLVDVVLLLLIFFIFSSSLIAQPGIKIRPPAVSPENVSPLELSSIEIRVTAQDTIFINKKKCSLAELKTILKDMDTSQATVTIKADIDASFGRMITVWDACKVAGIDKLNIATRIIEE